MSQDNARINDAVGASISPPQRQDYGAILSATEDNIHEISMSAVQMMKITQKPILIILKGGS